MEEKADWLQVRRFHDGTYSVMVRVWDPQKKFYEHPTLINLSQADALKHCDELKNNPPTVQEVIEKWEFIGT
ncbi:hypothetical protein [Niallia taxi]|uniref:hypothetical protein n=1 Tax=Niallia taxi TaxID=2499688 RepID=UPI0015F37D4C|nr:hypothetical protein [Niallia taxi]